MSDELREQSWIFDMFILDRIDPGLHSLICLDLKLIWLIKFRSFQTFSAKYLLESFLMFSCVFTFSKASFCALTSSFTASSSYRPRPPLSSVDICSETVSCSPSARNIILELSLISPFVWYLMSMQSVNRPFSIFVTLVSYANILLMMLQRSLFMPS